MLAVPMTLVAARRRRRHTPRRLHPEPLVWTVLRASTRRRLPRVRPACCGMQMVERAVAHGRRVGGSWAGHSGSPASLAIPAGKSKRGLSLVVATSGQAHNPRLRAPILCR
jgi:hypothetical protein